MQGKECQILAWREEKEGKSEKCDFHSFCLMENVVFSARASSELQNMLLWGLGYFSEGPEAFLLMAGTCLGTSMTCYNSTPTLPPSVIWQHRRVVWGHGSQKWEDRGLWRWETKLSSQDP